MSTSCSSPGWGTCSWSSAAWSGSISGSPGGSIPTYEPDYDVFCVGHCSEIQYFTTYDEVQEYAVSGQIYPDTESLLVVTSGYDTLYSAGIPKTALIYVDVGIPAQWTYEFDVQFVDLPVDFSNIESSHVFFGSVDNTGASAGLFFSKIGIAYTGNVYYDGVNTVSLNSAYQILPDSQDIVAEGVFYTVRLVVDYPNSTTYVYITESEQIAITGHILRFVLPTIATSTSLHPVNDGSYISVRGSTTNTSTLKLRYSCLGSSNLLPNLLPIADAGVDQTARTCTIIRLDGTGSMDPEGANLQYHWRLIDGPSASSFVFECHDGITTTSSTTYTDILYSASLGSYHEATDSSVEVGDVILLTEGTFNIIAFGYDGANFYVQIDDSALALDTSARTLKLLKQNNISAPLTAQPTFYPDCSGLFKFDLQVYDGQLYSLKSATIVNVISEVVPRGCIPDVGFLWDYISNFWKLVDNKDPIETFWGAVVQLTASEMLTLWQVEYNKSLRDIQRAFQRRWLHYDLRLIDRNPTESEINLTPGGVYSLEFTSAGLALAGQTLEISVLGYDTFTVMFQGTGALSASYIANRIQDIADAYITSSSDRLTVELLTNSSGNYVIRILSSRPFSLTSTATSLFEDCSNSTLSGDDGLRLGDDVYLVDRPVTSLGIEEDDLLFIDGEGYRIQKVIDKFGTDTWHSQRIVLKDALPATVGSSWTIAKGTVSAFLNVYDALLTEGDLATFEVETLTTGVVSYVTETIIGVSAKKVDTFAHSIQNIFEFVVQPELYAVRLKSVHRRQYMPLDSLVLSVPHLRELIVNSDDTAVLRENVDYFLETYRGSSCLRFVVGTTESTDVWQCTTPPNRMWAETTFIDNRPVIEANFGIPAEFTLDNYSELQTNMDYLSAVRGMWYSHFHGPTVQNLRIGTQILLGLPFAEKQGTIEEIRNDFSTTQGRILIRDAVDTEIVRFYTYPKALSLEVNPATGVSYAVGDTVEEFAPLVEGVEVSDYVKDPTWFAGYLAQGAFCEIEKFFKFLVRVDSAAFSLSSILFVRSFILRIKPTYTFPMFVVLLNASDAGDPIDITDTLELSGTLLLQDDISWRGNGAAMRYDDWRAAGGGWTTSFDSGNPVLATSPTYPTSYSPVPWGFDQSYLSPSDFAFLTMDETFDGTTYPTFDTSMLCWDGILYEGLQGVVGFPQTNYMPEEGHALYPLASDEEDIDTAITISTVAFETQTTGAMPTAGMDVTLWMTVNGTVVATVLLTDWVPEDGGQGTFALGTSVALAAGDTVQFFMKSTNTTGYEIPWLKLLLYIGTAYIWSYDTLVPAGTYSIARML
jgi:hypothetical protein